MDDPDDMTPYLPDMSGITARIITGDLISATVALLPGLHHSVATEGHFQGSQVVLLDTVQVRVTHHSLQLCPHVLHGTVAELGGDGGRAVVEGLHDEVCPTFSILHLHKLRLLL